LSDDLAAVFDLMRRAPESCFQTLRGAIRIAHEPLDAELQQRPAERLLRVWLERPDRFRIESEQPWLDGVPKHELELRDGEQWWRAQKIGSDSDWQSPEWLSNQEPSVASGIIDHDCTRLLDPWPLLAAMLLPTAGACKPLGRAMVAGREAILLRWTRPAGEEPEVSAVVTGEAVSVAMKGPAGLRPIALSASGIDVAVDTERGVLLRFAESGLWSDGRRVEFLEAVFDEPLEPHTFRPSWATSEGTSIYSDALTGLLNRRYFGEALAREVTRAREENTPLALVVVDLDDLGQINNRFGHRVGNAALTGVADRIRDVLRSAGMAARCGGDEFAVILPAAGIDEAQHFYSRLREHITATPIEPLGRISLSRGIAELGKQEDWETFFTRANDALYRA
jgi:diguanylate cyclase (GGDEF)-like protein